MKQVLTVSKQLRAISKKHSRRLASGGSPEVIHAKRSRALAWLPNAYSTSDKGEIDLSRAFWCRLAVWTSRTPPADTRPHEIHEYVHKAAMFRRAGRAVLILEGGLAVGLAVYSWDMPWPLAAAAALAVTMVLAAIATAFVHILVDRDTEDDPREALRRMDTIAVVSMAVWAVALVATLLTSRLSSSGGALIVWFHCGILAMTLATPIVAGVNFSKAELYDWSRRLTRVYNHLAGTRERLIMLELEARRVHGTDPDPGPTGRAIAGPK